MNAWYLQQIRYTPVGEYLRLLILKRLARGPAKVEEVDRMVEKAVEALGVRYDWRVWPKLVEREVEIRGGVVAITQRGKWILELTEEEVAAYVRKRLGVEV
jgi:vacuolar-type H+-ATPase subunit E/Vma4